MLAADPENAHAWNARAWSYAQTGDLDKALADAERAFALNSEDANIIHTRAWIYLAKGELDLALADFDKALSLDAALVGAYVDRGRAYELKGERDKAIADYRKALTLDSQQSYDDEAKAAAQQYLTVLGVLDAGSGSAEVARQPGP